MGFLKHRPQIQILWQKYPQYADAHFSQTNQTTHLTTAAVV